MSTSRRGNGHLASALILVAALQFLLFDVNFAVGDQASDLVPRYLLGLVHAPEVHEELDLTDEQIADLELLFREIDGKWFPARNMADQPRLAVIDELEGRVREWFRENTSTDQQRRLSQLEFYAQGNRVLLRSDVAKELKLDAKQKTELFELASATQAAQTALAKTKFGDPSIDALQASLAKKTADEQTSLKRLVRPDQRVRLGKMLGKPYDPSRLSRIYAMAPEFGPSPDWINSPPLTLQSLRGKVVLVHFYAFQCHNCHANFDIYRRWAEEYSSDEVVVVGIQTPETSLERDADAVRTAASEKDLKFPIQIDLDSASWAAWGNTMWPTVYVVDQNGYIRHWWSGELNWKGATADQTIERSCRKVATRRRVNSLIGWRRNRRG